MSKNIENKVVAIVGFLALTLIAIFTYLHYKNEHNINMPSNNSTLEIIDNPIKGNNLNGILKPTQKPQLEEQNLINEEFDMDKILLGNNIYTACPFLVRAKQHYSNDKSHYPQLKFAISLLNSLHQNVPNENVFYSPFGLYRLLLSIYFGAAGETEKELKTALGLIGNKTDIEHSYKLQELANFSQIRNPQVHFNSEDKVYVSMDVKIRDSTKELLNEKIEYLDFANDLEQCHEHVNEFVANATENLIEESLYHDSITTKTQLLFVNVVYFKEGLASKFDKDQTRSAPFYKTDGQTISVDMMRQSGRFEYGIIELLNTKVLRLPYQDEVYSMFIFLPDSTPHSFNELIIGLTPEILDNAFSGKYQYICDVDVELPKFSHKIYLGAESVMRSMGIQTLFDDKENLTGFSEQTRRASFTHLAKVKVDEERSTVADTKFVRRLEPIDFPQRLQFKCDHPFVFVIHDQKTKTILFVGIYR